MTHTSAARRPAAFAAAVPVAVLLASGCGDSAGPSGGPVSVVVTTVTLTALGPDTATAEVVLDDSLRFTLRGDTVIAGVATGTHHVTARTTLDYLPVSWDVPVSARQRVIAIPRPITCRRIDLDAQYCAGHNAFYWPRRTLVLCPASGHFPTATETDIIVASLTRFLARIG